jgi:uncharacterized repeat protein (TIGR01451 family)
MITYSYVITNIGATPLAGPVLVTDGSRLVTCPAVNMVGNKDNYLDTNETITCSAPYTISPADVTTASITNVATATAGGVTSNQSGITLTLGAAAPSSVLKLAKTSSSATYGQAGETITYTFVITNTGVNPLGPSQFTITDNKLGAPVNCGPAETTLASNQSITCSAPYSITQADINLTNVTNSATASGGGQTSAAATVTIANLAAPITQVPPTTAPSSNFTPGSTIQHRVTQGEWLAQIAHCYGANLEEVIKANPQINDLGADLPPSSIVSVPSIGSAGKIYGPPCITFYTVQSGDTWESIAQRYNADIAVMQMVNPVALAAGIQIKVPVNSADGIISMTAAPTATALIRITIDPGQTTASRVGIINPNETIHYVINAVQGQMLSIKLTDPANEVAIGVNSPTGLVLKPLDTSPTWSTTVMSGGDHFINIMGPTGGSSKSYTLEVSLSTAIVTSPVPASGTSQSTPDDFSLEEAAIHNLPKANYEYTVPVTLKLNETFTVELHMSRSLSGSQLSTEIVTANALATSTSNPDTLVAPAGPAIRLGGGQLEVTPFMQANLISEDAEAFDIRPLHDSPVQILNPYTTVEWQWLITAKKDGIQNLIFVISQQAETDDKVNWHLLTTERKTVQVIVTFDQRLGSIDWKWIIGILVTALLIPAFWRYIDSRKKETSPQSPTRQKRAPKKK